MTSENNKLEISLSAVCWKLVVCEQRSRDGSEYLGKQAHVDKETETLSLEPSGKIIIKPVDRSSHKPDSARYNCVIISEGVLQEAGLVGKNNTTWVYKVLPDTAKSSLTTPEGKTYFFECSAKELGTQITKAFREKARQSTTQQKPPDLGR